jgi:hypothetical protein
MEAVGQLDEDHPHVARHGDDHLADVLRLLLFDAAELHLRQLGDAIDEQRHLVAELLADLLDRDLSVLHHVVQQRGGQSGAVELEFRADIGRAHRVADVGLPAGPHLVLMLRGGHPEGGHDQVAVEHRAVLLHLGQQPLEQLLESRGVGGECHGRGGSCLLGWA